MWAPKVPGYHSQRNHRPETQAAAPLAEQEEGLSKASAGAKPSASVVEAESPSQAEPEEGEASA